MEKMEHYQCFDGEQQVWQHRSEVLNCTMKVAVYLPPQAQTQKCPVLYWLSGLTCTEQNFITKSGFQRYAAEYGVIVVAPDTSPRGEAVADSPDYDLGQGAGFYLNATAMPWQPHYQMYDYIRHELPALIETHFPATSQRGIFGHSMGGHGALVLALRNPDFYQSVSAFAPIVSPSTAAWGQKAFNAYLGDDPTAWAQYDALKLVLSGHKVADMLIDQGLADQFYPSQLATETFEQACYTMQQPATIRYQTGYDHSYYFIASFIGEHIAYHCERLKAE